MAWYRNALILGLFVASGSAWSAPAAASPAPKAKPSPRSSLAEKTGALEKQVQALKAELDEFKSRQDDILFESAERSGVVRSFLSDRLSVGGFFETGLTTIWGPDTATQSAPASHTLGLNFAATFSKNLKFVGQLVSALTLPLANPDSDASGPAVGLPARRELQAPTFATLPAQAYIEYLVSDAFYLQGGIGYAPFGHALQQRELVLFIRRGGPQLSRVQDLVEPLWGGVNLGGHLPISSDRGRFGYNLYTFPFLTDTRRLGVGSRIWWESPEDRIRVGLSTQAGKSRTGGAFVAGADALVRLSRFTVLTEFARRTNEAGDPWSFYLEPNFAITPNILVYVFGDYAESPLNRTISLADPWKKLEYGGGVNWLPTAFTRFRAGLYFFDYRGASAREGGRDRDFAALDFSAGVAF